MERQKTAVEWYDNEINKLVSMLITNQLSISRYNDLKQKILNQAKMVEKEQIREAYNKNPQGYNHTAEHYYESKYGKDENKSD